MSLQLVGFLTVPLIIASAAKLYPSSSHTLIIEEALELAYVVCICSAHFMMALASVTMAFGSLLRSGDEVSCAMLSAAMCV